MASKTLVGIGSSGGGGALTVIYENINDHFADADWIMDSTSLSAVSTPVTAADPDADEIFSIGEDLTAYDRLKILAWYNTIGNSSRTIRSHRYETIDLFKNDDGNLILSRVQTGGNYDWNLGVTDGTTEDLIGDVSIYRLWTTLETGSFWFTRLAQNTIGSHPGLKSLVILGS